MLRYLRLYVKYLLIVEPTYKTILNNAFTGIIFCKCFFYIPFETSSPSEPRDKSSPWRFKHLFPHLRVIFQEDLPNRYKVIAL
jgi:hypothetical protein